MNKKTRFVLPIQSIYLLFFILVFLFHLTCDTSYGDSNWLFGKVLKPGSDYRRIHGEGWLLPMVRFTQTRYLTWTSRSIMELFEVLLSTLPHIVWRLLDSMVWTLGLYSLHRLILGKQRNAVNAAFCVFALLLFPVTIWSGAGWISATLCYAWCASFDLYLLWLWKEIYHQNPISKAHYLIGCLLSLYAMNQEQSCFLLLGILLFFGFSTFHTGTPTSLRAYLPFLAIGLIQLANALLCPGNHVRSQLETERNLPEFSSYTILDKLLQGILHTKNYLLGSGLIPLLFLLLCAFLALLLKRKREKKGIIPSQISPRQNLAILYFLCLILLTKIMMGFSATVISSGDRTGTFLSLGLLVLGLHIVKVQIVERKST